MRQNLWLMVIIIVNLIFRSIFVLYGYIATEEGTLIYNQQLAYQGWLPFVDYNAWNSLLNDYLIGWYHILLEPTILTQRIFAKQIVRQL